MRKIILTLTFFFMIFPVVSAGVTLNSPINKVYNFGENLDLVINILAEPEIQDILTVELICNNTKTEIYKEYISLENDEKTRDVTFPLISELIGPAKGACTIEYSLGDLTEQIAEFKLSSKINVEIPEEIGSYFPGETVTIIGTAVKESGGFVNGIIETEIVKGNDSQITITKIVEEGHFQISLEVPQKNPAGENKIIFKVYDETSGEKTKNTGIIEKIITIKPIPVNLELFLDNKALGPGERITGKAILHDQTGENMEAIAYLIIKDSQKKTIFKEEIFTGQEFEYIINESQLPEEWEISVLSEELKAKSMFNILEVEKIQTKIINNSLIVKNIGNIPYVKPINVKIGEKEIELALNLEVGQEEKYFLTAPDGEYLVEAEGVSQKVGLTGNAIDIKKSAGKAISTIKPAIWIFLIFILGFVAFMIFKKGYKKTFFGRKIRKPHLHKKLKTKELPQEMPHFKDPKSFISPEYMALMSLSINGNKQTSTIVDLHIKNYSHMISGEGGVKETVQKITNLSDSKKILTYQSGGNFFFILAPEVTKTFQNEISAVNFAEEIKKIILGHNKLFKQKMDFGISIDNGEIVLKKEQNVFRFAAMGNLLNGLKKISVHSKEEIFLSSKIREKLSKNIRVERKTIQGKDVYSVMEVAPKIDNSKFIKGFMERLERDRKK
ncbi:MAG: hypothetical protein KC516_04050 [Nanoarchaeota archaeon]|nr:hypothetical protein [Nanoarchaeota archaeon]